MYKISLKGIPFLLILALALIGGACGGKAEAARYSLNLSSLSISGGTLTQGNENYYADIKSSSFTVTAVPSDSRATVTVDGRVVSSANNYTSQPISMSPGAMKTVTIRVSAGGSHQEYYIEALRSGNTNTNLSNLYVSGLSLNPSFSKTTNNYTVSTTASSVTVAAIPESPTASVTVNNQSLPGSRGWESEPISLKPGYNQITVRVFGSSGAINTYYITVTQQSISNSYLTALNVSGVSLSPHFSKTTNNYTASTTASSVMVTAVPESGTASVTVNGQSLSSSNGWVSQPISIASGSYTQITVRVSGSWGAINTYSILIYRNSTNPYLTSLVVGGGSLSPSFNETTTSYSCNVNSNIASTTIAAVPEDKSATVTVNGQTLDSSYISWPISLNTGSNQIRVTVSGAGGSKTYYINVIRAGASSAYLYTLSVGGGNLSPSFSKTTTSYTCNVSSNVASITVAAAAEDSNATVMVNDQTLGSSHVSQPISLNTGSNQIRVTVSGAGGSKTYYINVIRAGASSAYLYTLSVGGGILSPSFSKTTTSYTCNVNSNVASTTIAAAAEDSSATITVNDQTLGSSHVSQPISLNPGSNQITVTVSSSSGPMTYNINVIRAGTSSAYLSSLYISGASLSPSFSRTTNYYTAYLNDYDYNYYNNYNYNSYITVTAIPEDSNSTVTIDGRTVSYGSSSQDIYIGSGTTRINIQVYNPSNGNMNYYIDVSRNGYNNRSSYLSSLYINGASLNQSFYPSKTSYTATSSASSVTVTAVPEDSRSRVTVEGETLDYYDHQSRSIYLSSGVNRIDIRVYNPNTGGSTSYYIDITRDGGGYGAIETNSATGISSRTATLNARINSSNSKRVEAYGFCYGTDQNNLKMVTVANGSFTGSYNKVLQNLQPNTHYYFKAFMWNNYDYYTYGSTLSFYTTSTGNEGIVVSDDNVMDPYTVSSFWDVPSSHWAYGHIYNVARLGYMTGYPDSSFHPGYGISRAEIASVMVQILKINSYDTSTRHFYDVNSGDWFYAAVEKAYQRGIISGQGGYFSPNRAATREELAEVLVKALGKQSEAEGSMYESTGFYDDSSISSSARGYVVTAVKYGLITGYNNRFNPKNSITRAEVAAMLTTFLSKYR